MNRPGIVVTGNLREGFTHYGPFPSEADAAVWADETFGFTETWNVIPLYQPEEAIS